MNDNANLYKSLDENRAYMQGFQYGRSGASRSQYEPVKKLLPERLHKIFELGRWDGFLASVKEANK